MTRTDWLWQPWVPAGKITTLDGDPGLGKSTLALTIAAHVTRGEPLPGDPYPRDPGGVLFLSAEDDVADTIRPRLEAAGADVDRVNALNPSDPWWPSLPSSIPEIREEVLELDIRLIVLDPITAFLDADVDSHVDAKVRSALFPLRQLCEETGVAALLLRHLNKQAAGSKAIYRGGGSIAFVGAARSGMLMAKHPDQEGVAVLSHVKTNLGPKAASRAMRLEGTKVRADGIEFETVRVEWLEEIDLDADELLARPRAERRGEDRVSCADWLRQKLVDGDAVSCKRLKEEAAARGWGFKTLQRAGDDLGVEKTPEPRAGGGTLWALRKVH